MSNVRPAPLFLTPQVTRGLLGIGHPKRTKALKIEGTVNGADKACTEHKNRGGGVKPCRALDLSLCAATGACRP